MLDTRTDIKYPETSMQCLGIMIGAFVGRNLFGCGDELNPHQMSAENHWSKGITDPNRLILKTV
jgi:hypothetical protein